MYTVSLSGLAVPRQGRGSVTCFWCSCFHFLTRSFTLLVTEADDEHVGCAFSQPSDNGASCVVDYLFTCQIQPVW